jgi:hypothetical protein
MKFIMLICFTMIFSFGRTQIPVNYDEDNIPPYELPDPLTTSKGKKVTSQKMWENTQRVYILNLFKEHVYGAFPGKAEATYKVVRQDEAFNGKAIMKQVVIILGNDKNSKEIHVLIVLPKGKLPAPVFMGLNFCGNHCTTSDPNVELSKSWINNRYKGVSNNMASDSSRGSASKRWPFEEIIDRGYGVVTIYNGDIEPDHENGWKNGVRGILQDVLKTRPEEWGGISAWAWGLSQVQDYLEQDKDVDASKTIVFGHSRLGKAALWAGANDQRFAAVISNNSGEGGAALSKRVYGETIAHLNTSFPHWFVSKYKSYNGQPNKLPVDQHMLLSLMAPRPVYVASAEEDRWADPKGEFLALQNAEPVYSLYNIVGLNTQEMPEVNKPTGNHLRYHIRTGVHDVTLFDWQQYINFADEVLPKSNKKPRP